MADGYDVIAAALAKEAPTAPPAPAPAGESPQAEAEQPGGEEQPSAQPEVENATQAQEQQEDSPQEQDYFLDKDGKIDWRALEARTWYPDLPAEVQASLKGTLSAYRKAMADHKSAAGIRRDAENTSLREQIGMLQGQMDKLMGAVGQRPAAPPERPQAPEPPSPASQFGEDPDLQAFLNQHPAYQRLSSEDFIPPAELARLNAVLNRDIARFETARMVQPLQAQAQFQDGLKLIDQITEQFKGDPAHPVLFRDAAAAFDEAVSKKPWLAGQLDAMIQGNAGQGEIADFVYHNGINFKPELLASAAAAKPPAPPPPPPKPAPGKLNAAPVSGAAPSVAKTPATDAMEFVKACKNA